MYKRNLAAISYAGTRPLRRSPTCPVGPKDYVVSGAKARDTASIFPSYRRTSAARGQDLTVSTVVGTSDSYLILAGEPELLSCRFAVARVEDEVSCVYGTGERGLRYRPDSSGYGYGISPTSFRRSLEVDTADNVIGVDVGQ